MQTLFDPGRFETFGTVQLAPTSGDPPLYRIGGRRPSVLLREVRLCCPRRPGVYGMVDTLGNLHYVGKAKDLRRRLLGYFRPRSRDPKAGRILARSRGIVWETWPGEFGALLRELELIRRWRPRWNVQGQPLRRRHVYVCLGRAPAPFAFLSRLPGPDVLSAEGPVPLTFQARAAVRQLNDHFRLRDCPQSQEMVFAEDNRLWPESLPPGCVRLELGTCLGPCTGECPAGDYHAQTRRARSFLGGKEGGILESLQEDMEAAGRACRFERAAVLRDRLQAFRWLQDRLERGRRARRELSFLYPQPGRDGRTWWYAIQAGRPIAAAVAPHNAETARRAADLIQEIYFDQKHPALADSFEHLDGAMLVTAWFRKRPEEQPKTILPHRALTGLRKFLS